MSSHIPHTVFVLRYSLYTRTISRTDDERFMMSFGCNAEHTLCFLCIQFTKSNGDCRHAVAD